MRYSVWNNATRKYDYYEAKGANAIHAGAPPTSGSYALGATPEQAAWPLPAGAVKVGTGETPEGRIASTSSGGFRLDVKSMIIYGVLGYLLVKAFK